MSKTQTSNPDLKKVASALEKMVVIYDDIAGILSDVLTLLCEEPQHKDKEICVEWNSSEEAEEEEEENH